MITLYDLAVLNGIQDFVLKKYHTDIERISFKDQTFSLKTIDRQFHYGTDEEVQRIQQENQIRIITNSIPSLTKLQIYTYV